MSSELARRLIREAIAAIELPPVRIPDAGPARQSALEDVTACDAGQPEKTSCNDAGRLAPNEATARPVSEGRTAPRMPFTPGAALGAAGKTPGISPAVQPDLTQCNVVQPGVTRAAAAPNEAKAAQGVGQRTSDASPAASLTPRQLAAVRAMLSGIAPAAVAQAIGVSRQTIWRWSRLPEFAAELCRLHTLAVVAGRGPMNKAGVGRV